MNILLSFFFNDFFTIVIATLYGYCFSGWLWFPPLFHMHVHNAVRKWCSTSCHIIRGSNGRLKWSRTPTKSCISINLILFLISLWSSYFQHCIPNVILLCSMWRYHFIGEIELNFEKNFYWDCMYMYYVLMWRILLKIALILK